MDTRGENYAVRAPTILSGIIQRVNPAESTVEVKIDEPDGRYLIDCTYASPVQSSGISGIDFSPVRGSSCIVLETFSNGAASGDGGNFVVIGFRSRSIKSLTNRSNLREGDIEVRGQRGNTLLLTRDGDILLVADKQNFAAFLATEQLVKIRSASYEHELAGGFFNWSVQADSNGGPITCSAEVKRFASDTEAYLTFDAGTSADGGIDIVMHRLGSNISEEANPLFNNMVHESAGFRFRVSSEGEVEMSSTSLSVETSQFTSIRSNAGITLEGQGININSMESSITMTPGQPVKISAPHGLILDASSIKISTAGVDVLNGDITDESKHLCTIDLLDWLFNHIHLVKRNTQLLNPSITTCPLGTPNSATGTESINTRAVVDGEIVGFANSGDAPSTGFIEDMAYVKNNYSVESIDEISTTKTKVI